MPAWNTSKSKQLDFVGSKEHLERAWDRTAVEFIGGATLEEAVKINSSGTEYWLLSTSGQPVYLDGPLMVTLGLARANEDKDAMVLEVIADSHTKVKGKRVMFS